MNDTRGLARHRMPSPRRHGAGGLLALMLLSPLGCGPAPSASSPEATGDTPAEHGAPPPRGSSSTPSSTGVASGKSGDEFDPCAGSAPVPKPYAGILRTARCDQDMFLTMASVAQQLGLECDYCHVKSPEDSKFHYPDMTERKQVANWMSMHLMSSLRRKDGQPMRCKSCHTDEDGKPVARILGNPRDPQKAQEWMSLVMVNDFVKADGSKLRCKDCHGANFGQPEFKRKVILETKQLPAHEVGERAF
jgi:hypothetical protein